MAIVDDRYIVAESLSCAWLDAVRCVDNLPGRKGVHLLIRIKQPLAEVPSIRSEAQNLIDTYNAKYPNRSPLYDLETTRNTIFPVAWASRFPDPEDLVAHFRRAYSNNDGLRSLSANQRGTYFGRIVSYPRESNEVGNQLGETIRKLRNEIETRSRKSSRYEINIYSEARDGSPRGFPCLSHLSLHLDYPGLHMQAIYRNESLLSRAYGNYLGLAALLHYVAKVVGLEVGELLVTAGHVELEPGLHKEIRMMLSRHSQDKLLAQAFE